MEKNQIEVSWQDIETCCKKIASDLLKEDPFDAIICVGRGGMVPSRLISEYLDIKSIHLIPCHSYDNCQRATKVIVGDYDFKQFEGKNLLIVDDIYTTGRSIKAVGDKIMDSVDVVSITDATCYLNKHSQFKPDVSGKSYDGDSDWIVFPWEHSL